MPLPDAMIQFLMEEGGGERRPVLDDLISSFQQRGLSRFILVLKEGLLVLCGECG
jgi:hypothetical protein